MTQEEYKYLQWRCKMNWPNKYLKSSWYMDTWISNVLPTQLQYFRIEMQHLIDKKIYDTVY